MTWYLWTLLSMISGSFEQIIDKVVVIKNPAKIDVLIATFYRNFGFFFFTALAGVLGIFGHLSFVWNLPFLILALISPLHSLVYDYFLRTVELSRSQAVLYALPLFFVFIDKLFFGIAYSLPQLIGVMLLVFGALIFSFNEKQKKSAFSKKGLLGIALYGATSAYLLIAFKLYESTVNEISFYFSVWTLVIIFYVVLILATGKYKKLKETAVTEGFLKKTFASKGCDFLSSIFYLKALAWQYQSRRYRD